MEEGRKEERKEGRKERRKEGRKQSTEKKKLIIFILKVSVNILNSQRKGSDF